MALLLVLLVVIEGCGGEGDTPIFCVLLVLVGGSICYMIVGLKPGDGHIFFFFFFFCPSSFFPFSVLLLSSYLGLMHGRPVFGWASIVLMLSFLPLFGFVFLFLLCIFTRGSHFHSCASLAVGRSLAGGLACSGGIRSRSVTSLYVPNQFLVIPLLSISVFFFPPKIPNSHDDISSLLLFFILMAVIVAKSA